MQIVAAVETTCYMGGVTVLICQKIKNSEVSKNRAYNDTGKSE